MQGPPFFASTGDRRLGRLRTCPGDEVDQSGSARPASIRSTVLRFGELWAQKNSSLS